MNDLLVSTYLNPRNLDTVIPRSLCLVIPRIPLLPLVSIICILTIHDNNFKDLVTLSRIYNHNDS